MGCGGQIGLLGIFNLFSAGNSSMRFFGGSLLFLTLSYALIVVIPAYSYGVQNLMAKSIHDVPPMWSGRGGNILSFLPCLVVLMISIFGGPIPLVVFLSIGLLVCIFTIGKKRLWQERIFWAITLVGSGIFFYTSTHILEIWMQMLSRVSSD
jgi:hypothetical protein